MSPSEEDSFTFGVNAANGDVFRLRGKKFKSVEKEDSRYMYMYLNYELFKPQNFSAPNCKQLVSHTVRRKINNFL